LSLEDFQIDDKYKTLLPDIQEPSDTFKRNKHPLYKKYLMQKEFKRNVKKKIKKRWTDFKIEN